MEQIKAIDKAYDGLQTASKQFSTDFSDYEIGGIPSDWSTLWRDSGWEIKENPTRLEHFVTEGGKRRVLTWDEADLIYGDVEVVGVVRAKDFSSTMFQMHLQASGTSGSEYSYYVDLRKGKIRINRNRDSYFDSLKSGDFPYSEEADTWYEVVFKKEDAVLKAKAWPYGEEEPDDWQVEVEDDSFDKGQVGVGHVSSGVTNDWAYFGVGTNDEEAPRAPKDLIVDKSSLIDKVDEIEAEDLEENAFTTASWDELQNALNEAKALLEQSDVKQTEITEQVAKLDHAFANLQTASGQFATDFSEEETGKAPSTWSTLWRDSGWEIKEDPSRLEHFVTEGGKRRVLTMDEADLIYGDVEVTGVVRAKDFSATQFQIHLQASGSGGSENSYYADLRKGKVRINRNRDSYFDTLQSADFPYEEEANTWYEVAFKKEGATLKAKIWPFGEEEPDEWQVEVEDESFTQGKVGVGHVTSGVTNDWAYYAVGTNDEEAPRAPEDLFEKEEEDGMKTALQNKVDEIEAEELDASDYPEENWQALQTALNIANGLLDMDEAQLDQSIVDKSLSNLELAYEELE